MSTRSHGYMRWADLTGGERQEVVRATRHGVCGSFLMTTARWYYVVCLRCLARRGTRAYADRERGPGGLVGSLVKTQASDA